MPVRLYVPIGLPGSGKTDWCKSMLVDGYTQYVGTDEIRDDPSVFPQGYTYNEATNALVFDVFHERIEALLSSPRRNVVADATNLQARHRAPLIEIAERTDAALHYIFFTNVAQAVLRNQQRGGDGSAQGARVPDEAMLRFVGQYEVALQEVLAEPFDSLTYIERTL